MKIYIYISIDREGGGRAGTSFIENGRNRVKLWLFKVFNRFLNCPSYVAAGLFSYHKVLDPLER